MEEDGHDKGEKASLGDVYMIESEGIWGSDPMKDELL